MDAINPGTYKGISLLQEMVRLIWDTHLDDIEVVEVKAKKLYPRLHKHLMEQATIPGNQNLCEYMDSHGRTVKERLDSQAKDLVTITSGEILAMVALGNIRVDISHNDGMKQLLVCGGPFTDEINEAAKLAGFALKLTSGSAGKELSTGIGADDAYRFLESVGDVLDALSWHKLEWTGNPPKS